VLYDDLKHGNLPDYSFVEPVFLGAPSDYHPSDSDNIDKSHSSVLAGEGFLSGVYEAISSSPSRDQIAFLVTFDEHGGTMDHVPPPTTNPPNSTAPPGEFNFTFNRLGVRVPSILIGSYVIPGIYKDPLQHTSFLGFIRTVLGLPSTPLTERDQFAPQIDLSRVFSDTNRGSWPVTHPRNFTAPTNPVQTALGKYLGELTSAFSSWLASIGRTISDWWDDVTSAAPVTQSSSAMLLITLFVYFATVF